MSAVCRQYEKVWSELRLSTRKQYDVLLILYVGNRSIPYASSLKNVYESTGVNDCRQYLSFVSISFCI